MHFATRIDFELYVSGAVLANVAQNPNYPQVEHAQELAQTLADAYEARGYFSVDEASPLNRYIPAAPEGNGNSTREVGAVGGHSRVQFVRDRPQQVNQR